MPLIDTPIKRAKFYQLDLRGLKSTVAAISWNEVTGQNKLRHFFADVNWQNSIASIGVSSGGAKGGAFFLDVQPPHGGAPVAQYVVKGSTNPARTIFAEYILEKVGLAKIPKTLALEIDASDLGSEGMVMLNLLRNQNLRRAGVDQARYADALQLLWDGANDRPKVGYLVVQKLFSGEQLTNKIHLQNMRDRWLLQEKLAFNVVSILSDPNLSPHFTQTQAGQLVTALRNRQFLKLYSQSDSLNILGANFDPNAALPADLPTQGKGAEIKALLDEMYRIRQSLALQPAQSLTLAAFKTHLETQNTPEAQQLLQSLAQFITNLTTPAVNALGNVLNNQTKVVNLGRVLVADSVLGNADRIEGANWDNLFVVNKTLRSGTKVDFPIGVIDNDSLMQTFPHINFYDAADYFTRLLEGGTELDTPAGQPAAPTSDFSNLFADFNRWFRIWFVGQLIPSGMGDQPIVAAYNDPNYPNDADQGLWPQVKAWLLQGISEGLANIRDLNLLEVQKMHSSLARMYGVDANFDFQAFEIRHAYLKEVHVDIPAPPNPPVVTINHNPVKQELLARFNARGYETVAEDLRDALAFGATTAAPPLLTADEHRDILQLLAHLSTREQERLVPNVPKPGPKPLVTEERKKACICKILRMFLYQYNSDLYLDFSNRFVDVNGTRAYALARRQIQTVSDGRIYRRHEPQKGKENALGRYVVTELCGLDPAIYWS